MKRRPPRVVIPQPRRDIRGGGGGLSAGLLIVALVLVALLWMNA